MSKLKGVVVAVGILVVSLVAGCGGSGSDQTLTKAEFMEQAGAICKESEQKRGKIIAEVVEQTDPKSPVQAQQEKVIRQALPTYEEAAQQINDLGAPEGQEKKIEALTAAMEEAADKAMSDPHTAATSNIFFRKADQLAESYKLSGCII